MAYYKLDVFQWQPLKRGGWEFAYILLKIVPKGRFGKAFGEKRLLKYGYYFYGTDSGGRHCKTSNHSRMVGIKGFVCLFVR